MSGTTAGSVKAAKTNKAKYGGLYYAAIGSKGGRRGRTGGFYVNRELAREAGRLGGLVSQRRSTAETLQKRRQQAKRQRLYEQTHKRVLAINEKSKRREQTLATS
ncbi:hypothetical protein UFOVP253_61 [uncultured Caudovirales phage]|uniref:Uncharacterized protein n=1 Tax=uncultured Caudovirales phage TaxID=2100421 RepID=A0A6J5LGR6_9CAUD|nr:hypothetical protein UFOVP253_61 [uncultured Caudovirales phage]